MHTRVGVSAHAGEGKAAVSDPQSVRADDLRYLVAVVDTGRLTSAAKLLGVDHSTVSRRLQALEQALNTRLLIRSDERWELTGPGRTVMEHARNVVRAVELAAEAVDPMRQRTIDATVRVTAADGFGALIVTPAMARVQLQHPRLRIELATGARELTLRDAAFDIAVTPGPPPPATRLFTERLCEYDNGFYASASYLAKHGNPDSIEELTEHTIISFVEGLEKIREIDLSRLVPDARVAFSSTNIFAQLQAIRQEMGIGLVANFVARTVPDLVPVAAYVPPARVLVTLAVRREALKRPEIQVVREALHQEVQMRRGELI